MLDMGGVAVDRQKGGNYVQAMIDEFARRDEFMLTIAPEGTRGSVRQWKTGFYHIAVGANVPLVVGMMDYGTKTGGLGPMIWPTGDYEADMAKVAEIYAATTPKHPAKGNVEHNREGCRMNSTFQMLAINFAGADWRDHFAVALCRADRRSIISSTPSGPLAWCCWRGPAGCKLMGRLGAAT